MAEKRKFLRFGTFLDGAFTAAAENIKGLLMITDASREGVKAAINRRLPEGADMEIEIYFPGSIVPIFVMGKIIWLRKSKGGWTYEFECGIRLLKIDAMDRQRILDYAYENWKQSKNKS